MPGRVRARAARSVGGGAGALTQARALPTVQGHRGWVTGRSLEGRVHRSGGAGRADAFTPRTDRGWWPGCQPRALQRGRA